MLALEAFGVRALSDALAAAREAAPDAVERIDALQPLHPHHYLAAGMAELQWELALQQGLSAKVAVAASKVVACREAILGSHTYHRQTGFAYGDPSQHLQSLAFCALTP